MILPGFRFFVSLRKQFFDLPEAADRRIQRRSVVVGIKLIQQGTEITSILNIFLAKVQQYPVKTIAITGTKGKSTTSSILYHILKGCGYRVALLGNIGISVLDMYDDIDKYDYFVLEVSSYQATTIEYMVDYGIVLNLFKEHIQWHLTHDNYYRDKLNLLKYSKIKIVNCDNETIKKAESNKKYNMKEQIPYAGSKKTMYLVEDIDDKEKLKDIVIDTCKGLKI